MCKACRGTYLNGSPQERQEVATHGQQDKHAVKVEAGGRSSGPGQGVLATKSKSVKTACEGLLKPENRKTSSFAGISLRTPRKWQQIISAVCK